MKKQISIVGYGRFGKVLHRLLKNDFIITLYDQKNITDRSAFTQNTIIASNLAEVYKNNIIFYAVPIESFDHVINDHKKYFRYNHLLIDVLSVKLHAAKVFKKYLKGSKTQALLTHPMFGPDSSKFGFDGLPMILDRFKASRKNYNFWLNYFLSKKLKVIELTAKQHDQLAANSQGLTHFLGRLLDSFGLEPTPIDSLGTKKLLEIKEQTCNDTWQLFTNLQHYNPYTAQMRLKLGQNFDKLYNGLLPKQIKPGKIVFGIQGGQGSFNEEALLHHIKQTGIKNYQIKYLYTSANVLKALHQGKIDIGQFAIHNSAGGMVDESIQAMAKYKFKIINKFSIQITHALMIRPDAKPSQITTIMTHPQVLAQCKHTLQHKYSELKQTSGQGKYIDHALVAKNLANKMLSKHIATMGSRVLAQLYGLKIIEDNLQDLKKNFTTFLQISRN